MAYIDYMELNVWCPRKAVKHDHSLTLLTYIKMSRSPGQLVGDEGGTYVPPGTPFTNMVYL